MTKEKADFLWKAAINCKDFGQLVAYETDYEFLDMVHGENTIAGFLDDWSEAFRKPYIKED